MKINKVCCLLLVFIMLTILTGCTEKKREFPVGCDVNELLLDVSDLPESANTSSSGQPIPDSTVNSAGSSFYINGHLLSHAIYWYSSEKYSIRKYEKEVSAAKLVNTDDQSLPAELVINSLHADNNEIVCGKNLEALRCIYIGRYKKYITVLNSEIAEDSLSFVAYQEQIKLLDGRIFACE